MISDIFGNIFSTLSGMFAHVVNGLFVIVEFSKEDMAKSLLHMISNDIGQLACLYAKLHNLSRVYFGGFFIRGHPVTMHTITYSINFFTKATLLLLLFVVVVAKSLVFVLYYFLSITFLFCILGGSSGLVPET